jgi:hypothetical protein
MARCRVLGQIWIFNDIGTSYLQVLAVKQENKYAVEKLEQRFFRKCNIFQRF